MAILNKRKNELEDKVNTLELKAIHLNSIAEQKENTIRRMDDEMGELQFNAEMLSRDLDKLEARVHENETTIAAQQQTIAGNNEKIMAMEKENEMLAAGKRALETEISNRQSLILGLKTELIIGTEEYRMLAEEYSKKLDKLRRYRDLYGKLDDGE